MRRGHTSGACTIEVVGKNMTKIWYWALDVRCVSYHIIVERMVCLKFVDALAVRILVGCVGLVKMNLVGWVCPNLV